MFRVQGGVIDLAAFRAQGIFFKAYKACLGLRA